MQATPYFPADPVARLLELSQAIANDKRWFQGWSMLRYAAVGLITSAGEPEERSNALFEVADELKASAGWFGTLNSDVRFCIAASLMRHGHSAAEFSLEFDALRKHFRALKLPRGEAQEAMACLVLMNAAPDGVPSRAQAEALARVYVEMKAQHRILTDCNDLPAAALLSTTGDALDEIIERVEALHDGLRDMSFKRGNQLQLASHLLYFAPDADAVVLERFRGLYDSFREAGLRMNAGDYDEVSILAFLEHEPRRIVQRLLEDRERLRRDIPSSLSKQEGFTLATSTTFLHLATHDRRDERVVDALQMAQVLTLLQAQQAAAMVAASSAATTAATASN